MMGKEFSMFLLAVIAAMVVSVPSPTSAQVTFEWATVGNPGNAEDSLNSVDIPGIGSVADVYRIAKYQVTNDQYTEFLNAVAATDSNGLYHFWMGGAITQSGSSGSFIYSVKANMGNKPANYVSFFDAMRFVNWLHNGQPSGAQDASTTEDGVYAISDGQSETRAVDAQFFIPTENEWYKAAYHQPSTEGGDSDDYWLYPTASNSVPTVATANATGDISNPGANVANYDSGADWNGENGNVTTVGSAGPLSESFYGTYDQGGNVWEWNETVVFTSFRVLRGGSWIDREYDLRSSLQFGGEPSGEYPFFGFRVASPLCGPADPACVLFVDRDAPGLNNGSSWTDAYLDLQDALTHAAGEPAVNQIWVADGTYTPAPPVGDRTATFTLLNGVAIYGGFASGETSLDQRDILLNETILSGDLNGDDIAPPPVSVLSDVSRQQVTAASAHQGLVDFRYLERIVTGESRRELKPNRLQSSNRSSRSGRREEPISVSITGAELRIGRTNLGSFSGSADRLQAEGSSVVADNSLHVVTADGTDATPILDGFTITGGNADGAAFPDNAGGGVFNIGGLATIRNCRIRDNHAGFIGGGMFNANGGNLTVDGCELTNNTSAGLGGGVYNFNASHPTFTGSSFIGNRAETLGGGMANITGCNPIVTNSQFLANIGVAGGGGVFNFDNANAVLDGCIFDGNLGNQGGGVATIDSDPILTACDFVNNLANLGGGLFEGNSGSAISACRINGNSAFAGGAFFSTLSRTSFDGCTMTQNDAVVGGAMYNHEGPTLSMCRCDVSNNVGQVGGAMYNTNNASVSITNTTLNNNTATGDVGVIGLGGAIVNIDGSDTSLTNCVLCSNSAPYGGAMLNIGSSPQLSSCTMSGNVATELGDAMFNGGLSFATVSNSILWNANVAEIFEDGTSVTTITFSDVFGGWPGTGNLAVDPLFLSNACDGLELGPLSLCNDAGDDTLLPADSCDLDGDNYVLEPIPHDLAGNPRLNGTVDMGAFEQP